MDPEKAALAVKSVLRKGIIIISIFGKPRESIKNGTIHVIQFYYTQPTIPEPIHNIVYYYLPDSYGYYLPQLAYLIAPQIASPPTAIDCIEPFSPEPFTCLAKIQSITSLKSEISETIEGPSESRPVERVAPAAVKTVYKKCQKLGI